jgi:Lipocalin-like domain
MASHAIAQQQTESVTQQLVGTWLLVLDVATRPDGTRFDPFGGNTKGILMFDRTGYFSIQYSGDARRKVASNDRLKGTPEEDKANSAGTQAYYGTYSVDAAGSTLTLHVERNSFPNWDNIDLKRTIKIAGDELKFSIPSISTGGATAENVWKRAK